ncbi:MAG TPA: ABC transporter permease, partial [Puia sp.]
MLKNYFKIAWRHLLKSKTFSLINILGLSIGMAVALLIGLWIHDELSYNHYYDNHSRLALVYDTQTWNGKTSTDREVDIPMAGLLKTQYADDIKEVALISPSESAHLLSAGNKKITGSGIFMQPQLPEMLTLHMLKGNRDGLRDPSSIMISASLAKALFGDIDPIGHTIGIDSEPSAKVTGVFDDLPRNTEYSFVKFLLPWDRFVSTREWVRDSKNQWGYHYGRIVVQLNPGVDFDKLNEKIKDLPKNYVKLGKEEIFLHPMDKLHLYNEFRDGRPAGGPIVLVRLFTIIGIFVLLLACINFMNLSTARSEKRAREVGIRKAVGSLRWHLIGQFLSESVLTALLSLLLALLLV